MKEINDYHLIIQQILTQEVPLPVGVTEVPHTSLLSTWSQISKFLTLSKGVMETLCFSMKC